jgi:hypothetical protein
MTVRRQALHSRESLGLSLFLSKTVMPATLSAVTPILRRCHRRDHASPRRIGRRI